jgi:hypothetical protein
LQVEVSRFESRRISSSVDAWRFCASSMMRGELRPRATFREQTELDVDGAEQLLTREGRVEDVGDLGVGAQALQHGAAQGGLPRSDFARDGDESLTLFDAVQHVRERLAVRYREIQEVRIRSEREGLLTKPIKRGIHPQRTTDGSLTH